MFAPVSRKLEFSIRAALLGSIGGLIFGYDLGVMSGALPSLAEDFHLSTTEKEQVTSLMLVGCVFGALFGGYLCDKVGRKWTVYLVAMAFIAGGMLLMFAKYLYMLYIGRFIVGIGVAVSAIVDISYLTEISPMEYRGALVSSNELMITIGLLLAFIIDYMFMNHEGGWRYMFGFPCILSTIWVIAMCNMPESPRWLIVKNRLDEARQIYVSIYDTTEEAKSEFDRVFGLIESFKSKDNDQDFSLLKILYNWRLSVLISVALMIFQNFSGHGAVLAYAPEFFGIAGYSRSDSSIATITIGIVKVLATVVSLFIVDEMGRKKLLLVGIAGMAVSLSVVVILLAVGSGTNVDAKINAENDDFKLNPTSSVLLLVSVCVFVACYAIGYGPITWLISSEVFADDVRGRTLGISTVSNWLGGLVVVATFLSSVDAIGIVNTLMYYVVLLAVAFLFVAIFVPETKMKDTAVIVSELHRTFKKFCCFYEVPICNDYNQLKSSSINQSDIVHNRLLGSKRYDSHMPVANHSPENSTHGEDTSDHYFEA